ncbi:disease resistance protein RPS4B-like isoform X2 [Rutidosis leptorrhynchoides]|uniref:disease resistance protein RPS4B-like isoform X2 n=1 Tax=Rutidosis leptorrhynchoides TaxID=125765 RepID=UPI003A9A6541
MMSYEPSSASSSITISKGYDVFLSFRGEDTRTGFTSHLYDALIRKHIRTYQDDKSLEIGNFIAPELLRAIEASKFAIVVLSPHFATSKWCLEEIVKIVDCRELGKLVVIPVFYHVSPSDVRLQRGCYVQGFTNHEVNPEIPPQKVETWKAAFKKLGDISGYHVTQHRKESEVVNEIVKKIFTDMQVTLPTSLPDGLVGIESRLNEVKRILNMESSEVRFIGICGMSGVGKTTLAEVVYEAIQNEFQESSFIENIKDISKERNTDLCKLQQKLLDDILKGESVPVRSVKHGQTLLKTKLRDLKVIIVLDDVNHEDQLTYLAGGREWFGNGSRIIITTTNTDLLNPHRINATYVCEELEGDEALSLFCQSAFGGHPTNGYDNLSKDIVKLAGGLPLALNVYGSLLCGKEERYWKEILKKFQEYPHKKVVERLEIGYARLDKDEQDTFRYIACFLKGRDKDLIKDILTDIGLYPECGIADLINKFLITYNHDDSIWMHDLLQQMCWEILRKDSERDNGKYIAIKRRQDIVDILTYRPKGMRTIEIINQEPCKVEEEVFFDDPKCFSKMLKLRFLRISNIRFSQGLNYLSNDLRILECQLETLWEKDLDLPNLTSINLSFSTNLIKIPDLTSTPKLLILNLEGCTNVKELHDSVLVQKRLQYLNLKGCELLQNLGGCIMEMDSLETLILSGCSNLDYIPEFGLNMKHLEHLYVNGTNIKKLPESLGKMCNLRKIDVSETSIEEIPSSTHQLKKLRFLHVHRCMLLSPCRGFLYTNLDTVSYIREIDLSYCNLSAVPEGIGLLYRLVRLDLSGNDFVLLPASISLLSNLKMLYLNNCKRLQSLPKLSIVNEESLYGLQIRFNYYISGEVVDFSRFNASSDNGSPTVSCFNCPRLAENESGSYLVDRILNSYLQLRTNYWITPAAVFEIVGAGSKIPSSFKLITSAVNVILEGPWIGVAICAVIAVHQIDASMDAAKYTVTAHIHVGEKHWMIPFPISFLMASVEENQLVFYWTDSDDLLRIVDSRQENNFGFSFSVEPDGNVEVTKFGVRFIREEDIFEHEDSASDVANFLFKSSHKVRWSRGTREAVTDHHRHSCHSAMRTIKFLFECRKELYSLDDIHKILKCLSEITQHVFVECKKEWRHAQLITLVYDYYRISQGISQLYKEFVVLLKNVSYGWLSLTFALEQMVAKGRTDDCTYQEMIKQLNDLEAAECVRFSDSFIKLLAYICKQIFDYSGHLKKNNIQKVNKEFDLFMTLTQVSSITLAGVDRILGAYAIKDMLDDTTTLDTDSFTLGDETTNKLSEQQHTTTFSSYLFGSLKKQRGEAGEARVSCLVNGCAADLNSCTEYHRRHRVCKTHSKSRVVTINGKEQRFCQQCSRFHSLGEFDKLKRSCRKRLDGHNRFSRSLRRQSLYWNDGSSFTNHQVDRSENRLAGRFGRGFRILDFYDNAVLVQELKMKMGRLNSFTNEGEVEMMTVIDKLHNKTDDLAKTIEDMSIHACKFSHDVVEAGVTLNQFIAGGSLQVTQFGVQFVFDEEANCANSMCEEAMTILFRAVSSLPTDLRWYIRACEAADSSLLSCHSTIIHDNTRNIINFITVGRATSVHQIHEIVNCVLGNNLEAFKVLSECKEEWRLRAPLFSMVTSYYDVCRETCRLYNDFVMLLKDVSDGLLSLKLEVEQIRVKIKEEKYTYKEMLQHLNGIKTTATYICFSGNIVKSFAHVCTQTVTFASLFDEVIQEFTSVKILAQVSSGLVAGVFSIMCALMVGYFVTEGRQDDLESVWLHLIRTFSLSGFLSMCDRLVTSYKSWSIGEFSDIDSHLGGLKFNLAKLTYFTEEHTVVVIDELNSLMTKIDNIMVSIEYESIHAHKYKLDIMEAGTSLGIWE